MNNYWQEDFTFLSFACLFCVQLCNNDGETALQVAVRMGHEDTAVYLMHRWTWQELGPEPLEMTVPWIAASGNLQMLTAICAKLYSTRLDTLPGAAQRGFLRACAQGHTGLVSPLYTAGANVNVPDEETKQTGLMYAAQTGQQKMIEVHASCCTGVGQVAGVGGAGW